MTLRGPLAVLVAVLALGTTVSADAVPSRWDAPRWTGGALPASPDTVMVPRVRTLPFDEARFRTVLGRLGLPAPEQVRQRRDGFVVTRPYSASAYRMGDLWTVSARVRSLDTSRPAPSPAYALGAARRVLPALGLDASQWTAAVEGPGRPGTLRVALAAVSDLPGERFGPLSGQVEVGASGVTRVVLPLLRVERGAPVRVVGVEQVLERVVADFGGGMEMSSARLVATVQGAAGPADGQLLTPAWEFADPSGQGGLTVPAAAR